MFKKLFVLLYGASGQERKNKRASKSPLNSTHAETKPPTSLTISEKGEVTVYAVAPIGISSINGDVACLTDRYFQGQANELRGGRKTAYFPTLETAKANWKRLGADIKGIYELKLPLSAVTINPDQEQLHVDSSSIEVSKIKKIHLHPFSSFTSEMRDNPLYESSVKSTVKASFS